MSHTQSQVAIVGAGIMGRILAWQLIQQGHKVSLFDKDPIESGDAAAYTAAGMLTPYAEIESAELLIYKLGCRSLELWPNILESLAKEGLGDVGYNQLGTLVVSHPQDKSDLKRFNQQLAFKLENKDFNDEASQVDQQALAQLEPELSQQFSSATYLPNEAWLSPHLVMPALAKYLLAKGVEWFPQTSIDKVQAYCVEANGKSHHFDWVIDCRGLGAKADIKDLRGVRGELIVLQAPEVKISRLVRLMHPRYRLYLVPEGRDDKYVIGATQIESSDKGPITVRSSLELLSAAYSLHPGFSEARILETRVNCRPALADNLPRISQEPGLMGVNGLYRHGFLLAPALAEQVSQCLQDKSGSFPHVVSQNKLKSEALQIADHEKMTC